MLIYLRGGGLCVPGSASKGCDDRCSSEPSLCTASTDPDYILTESNLGDNIGSNKQAENPAFWDYSKSMLKTVSCQDETKLSHFSLRPLLQQ